MLQEQNIDALSPRSVDVWHLQVGRAQEDHSFDVHVGL